MYTNYKLSIFHGYRRNLKKEINEWISSSNLDINDIGIELSKWFYRVKWDNLDHDMNKLSRAFSDVVFILEIEGSNTCSTYREFYKNGKVQRVYAKITFDDYDESELVDIK